MNDRSRGMWRWSGLLAGLMLLSGWGLLSAGVFDRAFVTTPMHPDDVVSFEPIVVQAEAGSGPEQSSVDWPMLFGPLRNSCLPDSAAVQFDWPAALPPVVWRRSIGTGYSSPVISAGKVIVLHRVDDEERVSCLDVARGTLLWEQAWPTTYVCPHPPHSSGPYSTPLICDDVVYVQRAEGELRCLRLVTGESIWARQLSREYAVPENVFAVGHTPALDGDQLILNLGAKSRQAGMLALNRHTGETIWTATDYGASYATPQVAVVHGQRYCFALTAEAAVAIDPADGSLFWEFPLQAKVTDFVNATSPVVAGDLVLFSAYQGGTVYSRVLPDRTREEVRHDRRVLVSQFNPLTYRDGCLYGWHFMDKSLRCVHLETGELKWKWAAGVGRGTHLFAGQQLLVFGESGRLAMALATPDGVQVLKPATEPLLEEPAFSAPAISGRFLVLRNEAEILCVEFGE